MSTTSTTMKSKRKLIRRMAIIRSSLWDWDGMDGTIGIDTVWIVLYHRCVHLGTARTSIQFGLDGRFSCIPSLCCWRDVSWHLKDAFFLLASYGVTMACHFASLQLNATSFVGVWRALFFFQTFRLAQFTWRVWVAIPTRNNESLQLVVAAPPP
jgi:hypothetical protein